ncbi:hypothetical protein A0H81_13521 [Grifola frondosa]|uniref:Uncharacterized protein n=1 Tax=Grifola frondosa TaxID=5627 RepID=A0A1C7LPD8_GRIFR|nr:hypothetical protein A0H81_13521 [Grifola frondosa]
MSPPHAHPVGVVASTASPLPEEDEDDICPEHRNRTFTALYLYFRHLHWQLSTDHRFPHPLKIKLTLPANLKFRKQHATDHPPSNPLPSHSSQQFATTDANAFSHQPAPVLYDSSAPKRRGRPPKAAVATREATKVITASATGYDTNFASPSAARGISHRHSTSAGKSVIPTHTSSVNGRTAARYTAPKKKAPADKGDKEYKARTTTGRKAQNIVAKPIANSSAADCSDNELAGMFPTFVSAASSSSHSSSSESSDSEASLSYESDSDVVADETHFIVSSEEAKSHGRKLLPSDVGQRKRDRGSGNNWEIRPRKKSVGSEEEADGDSEESSDEDEDGDDEDEEEDADADIEGGLEDADMDDEETSSRIGVSFGGGSGWSDDEESTFDADLFFANLDDSSDSGSSSPAMRFVDIAEDTSDIEHSDSLSADEEDALLLMDIDPSVQLRRSNGELEVGVELDGLAFGWDGLFAHARRRDSFDLNLSFGALDCDTEMETETEGSDPSGEIGDQRPGDILLQESDGETTEDELVDSDGLPNPRAMMLFRWPTPMRIALASISAHRRSPPPTPADILAGKISMDDLEDIEMDKQVDASLPVASRRKGGNPVMGNFVSSADVPRGCVIIDGKGSDIPSPYPRSTTRRRAEGGRSREQQRNSGENPEAFIATPNTMCSFESSEETPMHSQTPTSEFSSAEAIDLDDVLDASLLDSEPTTQDYDTETVELASSSSHAKSGILLKNLNRWDRIPMATFRRTRETATASGVDGSAGSDNGLGVYGGMGAMISNSMFAPPKSTDKKPRGSGGSRSKFKHANLIVSPVLLPTRDGDRTPTCLGLQVPASTQNKSKKESRKEKAMMKRKLVAKSSQYRYQQPHRTHHHHPNNKSRGSMQRTSSSIPPLSI